MTEHEQCITSMMEVILSISAKIKSGKIQEALHSLSDLELLFPCESLNSKEIGLVQRELSKILLLAQAAKEGWEDANRTISKYTRTPYASSTYDKRGRPLPSRNHYTGNSRY